MRFDAQRDHAETVALVAPVAFAWNSPSSGRLAIDAPAGDPWAHRGASAHRRGVHVLLETVYVLLGNQSLRASRGCLQS